MILAIYGKCVIAMNKNYWNELGSQLVDREIEKKIQKMYQYSLSKRKIDLNEKIEMLKGSKIKTPDIVLKRIEVVDCQHEALTSIFYNLRKYIEINQFSLCFPVMYFAGNFSSDMERGSYMFDFEKNQIVQIGKDPIVTENTTGLFSIFWLLDIDSSIILYGRSSLFMGIKEVMNVREVACRNVEKKLLPIYLNHQKILKDMNINPKLAYLIESDSIIG